MTANTANRIVQAQEKAMHCTRYQQKLSSLRAKEERLLELLSSLPQEQRDIIMEYCGTFFELHLYLLEIACQE